LRDHRIAGRTVRTSSLISATNKTTHILNRTDDGGTMTDKTDPRFKAEADRIINANKDLWEDDVMKDQLIKEDLKRSIVNPELDPVTRLKMVFSELRMDRDACRVRNGAKAQETKTATPATSATARSNDPRRNRPAVTVRPTLDEDGSPPEESLSSTAEVLRQMARARGQLNPIVHYGRLPGTEE
jgi:hypothetical protein